MAEEESVACGEESIASGDECVLGVCNGRRGVCCCLKIIVWLLRA